MRKYKTVQEFIDDLDGQKRLQVETLRKLILGTEPELGEHIKWNAPSYVYQGIDRITFNILNKEGVVKLVFHMGGVRKENSKAVPVIKDDTGLISWMSDIRGVLSFQDIDDINAQSEQLGQIAKQWLAIEP